MFCYAGDLERDLEIAALWAAAAGHFCLVARRWGVGEGEARSIPLRINMMLFSRKENRKIASSIESGLYF